jgi:hypothetical protein
MPGHNHYSGCRCGWCWGGGGWGSSSGRRTFTATAYGPTIGTTTRWAESSDCCWQTACPKCGAQVFFVRHNGGSVWFDSLGKPWPKHHCFADDMVTSGLRSRLAEREIHDRTLFIGVVIETTVIQGGGKVVIEHGNKERFESDIIASADMTELPGNLVLVTVGADGYPRLHWGPGLPQRAMALTRYQPAT